MDVHLSGESMKVDSGEKGSTDEINTAKIVQEIKQVTASNGTLENLILLHAKGLVSTQTLCEKIGLDYKKVVKEMTKQGLVDKAGNFSSPEAAQAAVTMAENIKKDFDWGAYNVPPLSFSSFSGCSFGVSGSAGPKEASGSSGYSGSSGHSGHTPKAEKEETKTLPPPEPIDENLTGFDRWDYIL
jgi:hypothetical protein